MWKLIGLSLWWLFLGVATVIVEKTLQDVPTDVLILVAAVLAALALPILYREGIKNWAPKRDKRVQDFSDFDMPVEMAIDHIVDSTHHSFNRRSLAERNAFAQLHTAMCSGRLAVIGKRGEALVPRIISPRQCRKLEGREVVTPHGMRFHLVEKKLLKGIMKEIEKRPSALDEQKGPFGFSELRVRSKDIYGIWPRNVEAPARVGSD